jgi:hypothetical protein
MRDVKEKKARCFNEGCRKPAEEGSLFCASCGLEWALFHRDVRVPKEDIRGDRISR